MIIFYNGAAVDWLSKLLKVKMSSPEAEIAAGCLAGKRGIYVRNLLARLSKFPQLPAPSVRVCSLHRMVFLDTIMLGQQHATGFQRLDDEIADEDEVLFGRFYFPINMIIVIARNEIRR